MLVSDILIGNQDRLNRALAFFASQVDLFDPFRYLLVFSLTL